MGITEYLDRVFKNNQEEGEIIYGVRRVLIYHFYIPKRFTILNLWPVLLLITFAIGSFFHLKNYLATADEVVFVDIGDDVTISLSTIVITYYHCYYFYNRHKFQILFKELGRYDQFELPDNITKINRIANFIAISHVFLLYGMFVVTVNALLSEECVDNVNDNCGLIFTGYYPFFNIHRSPYRYIYGIIQASAITTVGMTTIALALMVVTPAEILVGYLQKLKEYIIQVKRCKAGKSRKRQIKKCIEYHYRIIELSELYNDITRYIFVVLMFFGAGFIALCSYNLIIRFAYAVLLHLVVYFFTTFFICFFGERLIQESTSVAYTAYETIPWGDIETQKDLILLMRRAQLELFVDAGGLGSMRHELFMSVIKSTYSILTLLLNLQ